MQLSKNILQPTSCLYWLKCWTKADIAYGMSKWQRRQSTAVPPTVKSKITDLFQWNTAETSSGVVEPICRVDPGGSEVELQDCELSFPACDIHVHCDERWGQQAVTLRHHHCHVMSPLSHDMVQTTRAKILAVPMYMYMYDWSPRPQTHAMIMFCHTISCFSRKSKKKKNEATWRLPGLYQTNQKQLDRLWMCYMSGCVRK